MTESKHGNFYVTKYALTKGVLLLPAEHCRTKDGMLIYSGGSSGLYLDQYFHGKDWHETAAAAEQRVIEMKVKRKKSLEAAIARLSDAIVWVQM